MGKGDKGTYKFLRGYRPVVHAREGSMLGIRQPIDGPVFKLFHFLSRGRMWAMSPCGPCQMETEVKIWQSLSITETKHFILRIGMPQKDFVSVIR